MHIFVHEGVFCIQSYFSKVDSQKLTFTKLLKYHQIVCQHGLPASHPTVLYQSNELYLLKSCV